MTRKPWVLVLFTNIVGQAKVYMNMHVLMRHFKWMNFSKISWFKLPRICLEIDFTNDVLIKLIMDTLQTITMRLSWRTYCSCTHDALWFDTSYFTCEDMKVSWYQSMCFASVILNILSKVYFETICCEHLQNWSFFHL